MRTYGGRAWSVLVFAVVLAATVAGQDGCSTISRVLVRQQQIKAGTVVPISGDPPMMCMLTP
jgi:hypothetical protein